MASAPRTPDGKRIIALHDNPPLPGKEFFIVSMVSPESFSKHDVYGYKLHDVCESYEKAKIMAKYYESLDPDIAVAIGTVGKWIPWLFDPLAVQDVEYADERLTNLMRAHRENLHDKSNEWRQKVEEHKAEIQKGATKEGQAALASQGESAVAVLFKIRQVELCIKRRQQEKESLLDVFHTKFTKEERAKAKKADLPISEPTPMEYTLLNSTGVVDDEEDEEPVESGSVPQRSW